MFCNVLIVAKCIVNRKKVRYYNEGKVVLIVAKCIVNFLYAELEREIEEVLIVAKCIVNGHVRIIIKGLIEY